MSDTKTAPRGPGGPTPVHPVDEVLPSQRLFVLGLQHLFIMYAGAVAVPLIVGPAVGLKEHDIGILVSADLLVSGIATIIQSVGIGKIMGVRLPVVAGATFTVLNPMIIIANKYGIQAVYGALICSGVFGLLIAKPFSMVLRFFPPLVTGTVIAVIGLSLIGADIGLIAGQQYSQDFKTGALTPIKSFGAPSHIALAGLVILLIVLITRFTTGFLSQIAVLIAIVVGTLIAWPMGGMIHWGSAVGDAKWFGIAEPFHFGAPTFKAAAIISMCIVMLVTYTESTADMLAVAEMVDKELSPSDLARGLATDGLSGLLAGFMNSFPDTAYAENVGLIGMTKVRSRWVVTVCGVLLLVMGIIPKIGQLVAGLPQPVIGGAATVMFAMVTSIGIRTLHKVRVRGQPQPADRGHRAGRRARTGVQRAHLRPVPGLVPDHLRVGDHLDGDRGVQPEPALQPLERAAGSRHERPAGGHGARRRLAGRGRGRAPHLPQPSPRRR